MFQIYQHNVRFMFYKRSQQKQQESVKVCSKSLLTFFHSQFTQHIRHTLLPTSIQTFLRITIPACYFRPFPPVLPEVDRRRGKLMLRPWSSGALCSWLFALPVVSCSTKRGGITEVQTREFSTALDPLRPRTWR